MYVITGPVFTEGAPRIGNNGVIVPIYLFKPVYDQHANRAWAHWQENKEGERVGRPISYQELARRIGQPTAVRAVANANGQNRINILVPCHRVIGSTGKLVGFGGGLPRKVALLDLEQKSGRLSL